MKRIIILLVGIILISCSGNLLRLDNYFERANRKERKYLKSYREIESICIPKVKFVHEANTGIGTDGSLSINRFGIGNSLRESYSRCLNLSICTIDKKRIPIEHFDFPINIKRVEKDTPCCNAAIIPDLIITSYTSRNTEGGGGLELVYDMGNDKNWIEYKLVTAIYQNDTLIYMDNHGFWTTFFSERDEQVKYQVPQIVLDSLVSLSLGEYFKRME